MPQTHDPKPSHYQRYHPKPPKSAQVCKSGQSVISTALAIARDLQARTSWSIKKIVRTLRPLQHVTIRLAGQQLHAQPMIPNDVAEMLSRAGH